MKTISGFSKLSKIEKISFLADQYFSDSDAIKEKIMSYWHRDENEQRVFDEFSENTITNFYFPFGVVPNFKLNEKIYCVPMAIEESSVVAASARSANYWLNRGGFKAEVIGTTKIGQVHLNWTGESDLLQSLFEKYRPVLLDEVKPLVSNMEKRGGGLRDIVLVDRTHQESELFQLYCTFETCDAMGANFINSILECLGRTFKRLVDAEMEGLKSNKNLSVIMAILSNYTPDCRVRVWVECPISELADKSLEMSPEEFAFKFEKAIKISKLDVNRAVTHNKGIFNGIDAVVIATGNDFRAIEACGHAWAARDGQYRGLSDVEISQGHFKFSLEIPLALGTIGGLTSLHPLSKMGLDLLERPSAKDLMMIVAGIGLAQNFAAIRSLVTSGIQKGHMKMHLMNILNHLEANDDEREQVKNKFENEIISFNAVREFLHTLRKYQ